MWTVSFDQMMKNKPLVPRGLVIFKLVILGEAVTILVLIKNSQVMVQGWSNLQDHHLPALLGKIRLANPNIYIPLLSFLGDNPCVIG